MTKRARQSQIIPTSAILIAASVMAMGSTTAQAGNYYNCAAPTGCSKVESKHSRSTYNTTQYPIVMAHGFFGWNRLIGVLDYFNGVPQTLLKNGASNVFTTKTSSVNSAEVHKLRRNLYPEWLPPGWVQILYQNRSALRDCVRTGWRTLPERSVRYQSPWLPY